MSAVDVKQAVLNATKVLSAKVEEMAKNLRIIVDGIEDDRPFPSEIFRLIGSKGGEAFVKEMEESEKKFLGDEKVKKALLGISLVAAACSPHFSKELVSPFLAMMKEAGSIEL